MSARARNPRVHTAKSGLARHRALEAKIVGRGAIAGHDAAASHDERMTGSAFDRAWQRGFEQHMLEGGFSWSDVGKFISRAAKNKTVQNVARKAVKELVPLASGALIPGSAPVARAIVSGLGKDGKPLPRAAARRRKGAGGVLDNDLRDRLMAMSVKGGAAAGRRDARNALVKRVMAERGVNLPTASSIIKREGLF